MWRLLPCVAMCILLMGQYVAGDGDTASGQSQDATRMTTRTLRIVTIPHIPYTNITQGDNGLKYIGFIPDLIHALSMKLHFSYEFYQSPDATYGRKLDNGEWTGMMGELVLNKHKPDGNASVDNDSQRPGADMAAAPLTMTSKRLEDVAFIHPFHSLGLTVVVRKTLMVDNGTDTWPFDVSVLMILSPSVWGLVTLMAIVVGLLLFGLNHFNPYEWGARYNIGQATVHHKESFNLSGALWFVFTTLQWQGFERAPRSIASKILTCFWFAFVTLTLVTYIGGLVNYMWWSSMVLRHNPTAHPVQDLEDLVSGAGMDFKYGTVRKRSSYRYIMDVMASQKVEYQAMKKYWQTAEGSDQLVNNIEDGLHKVRTEKYAFIMSTLSAKWQMNRQPCDLTTIGEKFGLKSYGLAVPKNWPYIDQFNVAITEMTENGFIDQLEERWWEGRGECWSHNHAEKLMNKVAALYINSAKPKTVTLSMFGGPLVIMVVGIIVTVMATIGEVLYYRYKGRYLSSNRPHGQTLKLENEDGNI